MDNLLSIVRKIVNRKIGMAKLEELLKLPIEEFYSSLCKLSTYSQGTDKFRAMARVKEINDLLSMRQYSRAGFYLDIGGGNGIITKAIGESLGFRDVFSADVQETFVQGQRRDKKGVTYLTLDAKRPLIDLPDNSCTFITAIMSLHHILPEAFDKEMREISRVLAPGGYFIIREHDCRNKSDAYLIDMEHLLYDHSIITVTGKCKKYDGKYKGYYKPKEEWVRILTKYGLSPVGGHVFKAKNNPTRYYYQAFIKNFLSS